MPIIGTYLYIHRPFEVWPSLGDLRIELIYMILMCGYWLAAARKQWTSNPLHKAFFGFFFAALLCWALSPWPDHGALAMDRYYKLLVFYLILVTSVRDEEDLRRVLIAYLAVMTFYMMHSLWSFRGGRHHFRMGIVRLVGVDTSHGDQTLWGLRAEFACFVPLWHPSGSNGCVASPPMPCWRAVHRAHGPRTSFAGLVLLIALVAPRANAAGRWHSWLWCARRWRHGIAAIAKRFETIINPAAGPANADVAEDRSRFASGPSFQRFRCPAAA